MRGITLRADQCNRFTCVYINKNTLSSTFQETRHKKEPVCNGDSAKGVIRHQSKNGRKKRTKSKAPVSKLLRKRTPTISRRNSERSSPIKSARTVAKVSPRRATNTASGATYAVSDNEAEKSDTELDDGDDTEQESSSDGAEESLTLADVKKGLGVKGTNERTFPGSEDVAPTIVASAKKETSPSIDESTLDSDVSSSGDTLVIKTNIENTVEEKKAPVTKCTELVDDVVTIECRVSGVSADNDEKQPAIVQSVILTTESIDINNGAVRSEATISDESTSLIGDGCDSPILETEAEKDVPVENDTESNTQTPSVGTSCQEDDVTVSKEGQPALIAANNAYKSPSAIGCCALEEQVIGAAAAASHTNKTAEETEPVNGETAVPPLAAMPSPDDADSSTDTEDEYALGDATLPREERNSEAVTAKEQTQTDGDTEQHFAEGASSENRIEILRWVCRLASCSTK